jgi:hypothetical protein
MEGKTMNIDDQLTPLERKTIADEMEAAQKQTAEIRKVMTEEGEANRKSWETLHNNIAIFSSGTIALSITYLGYLQNGGAAITHPRTLFASWGCLMACVPMSLFVTFTHTYYRAYERFAQYARARRDQKKAEADALGVSKVVGMTMKEVQDEIDDLLKRSNQHHEESKKMKRKSRMYELIWRTLGVGSRVLFCVGLFLVLLFGFRIQCKGIKLLLRSRTHHLCRTRLYISS